MHRRTMFMLGAGAVAAVAAAAGARRMQAATPEGSAHAFTFPGLDGTDIPLADYAGRPVLVVNTASLCGFTNQYEALQRLHDRYQDRGFAVIGVPSDSFRQELGSAAAVAEFCEANFGITFPLTDILPVTGAGAHPFYAWAAAQGRRVRWNFHKMLLDGEGRIVRDFPASVRPDDARITDLIERLLPETG